MSTHLPELVPPVPVEYYTLDQAAAVLNKTKRTIYHYMKKGYLTRKRHLGRPVVLRSEVHDFARFGEELGNTNLVNPQVVANLLLRVNRLEAQQTLINRVLDLQRDPHRLSDHEAKLFYDGILGALSKPVTMEVAEWCADQMLRVDMTLLQQISKLVGDPTPSIKFYKMVVKVQDALHRVPNFETNLVLQTLTGQLERARKNMLALAGEQIERGQISGPHHSRILELVGSREEELERLAKMI